MDGDLLYQDRQQLQTLLEQYRDVATELPRLKTEGRAGWIEPLMQWGEGWLHTIWEWLQGMVGPFPGVSIPIDWDALLPMLWWLTMGLLVIGVARVFMRYCRSIGGQLRPGGARLPDPSTREIQGLKTRLATAIQQERWSLATRLRWCLFLSHVGLQSNTTPYEFFRHSACEDRDEPHQRIPIHEQYRMMFTATDVSRQWFDAYHRELAEIERERCDG